MLTVKRIELGIDAADTAAVEATLAGVEEEGARAAPRWCNLQIACGF